MSFIKLSFLNKSNRNSFLQGNAQMFTKTRLWFDLKIIQGFANACVMYVHNSCFLRVLSTTSNSFMASYRLETEGDPAKVLYPSGYCCTFRSLKKIASHANILKNVVLFAVLKM